VTFTMTNHNQWLTSVLNLSHIQNVLNVLDVNTTQ